jgi:hypothetical protein
MEKTRIYQLLSCYVLKKIKPLEWDELKALLENTNDGELLDVLEMLWENTEYSQAYIPSGRKLKNMYTNVCTKTKCMPVVIKTFYRPLRIAGIFLMILLIGASVYLY